MFVSDGGMKLTRYVNLDHVREITVTSQGEWKGYKTTFHFTNGEVATFTGDYSHEIPKAKVQIVPALPGYEMLTLWLGSEHHPEELLSDQVIAWEIDPNDIVDDMPNPITADGGCPAADEYLGAVLCPNGVVIEPHTGRWDSKEKWLADARKRLTDRRTAKVTVNANGKPGHTVPAA